MAMATNADQRKSNTYFRGVDQPPDANPDFTSIAQGPRSLHSSWNFISTFTEFTWPLRRTLTEGIDVKYVLPRGRSATWPEPRLYKYRTRTTELTLELKFYLDVHWVYMAIATNADRRNWRQIRTPAGSISQLTRTKITQGLLSRAMEVLYRKPSSFHRTSTDCNRFRFTTILHFRWTSTSSLFYLASSAIAKASRSFSLLSWISSLCSYENWKNKAKQQ